MWGYSIEFWGSVVFWATAIAAISGGISVACGFLAGFIGYRVSEVVQKDTAAQIAEANARGEAAKQAAAEANARAADANLALERYKAPRSIDPTGVALMTSKLGMYVGQRYKITTFWDSKEPLTFSNALHEALQKAGWTFVPHGQGGSFLLGGLSGIQVWVHPNALPQVRKAAEALIAVLRELDLSPLLREQEATIPSDGIVQLNVGTKL